MKQGKLSLCLATFMVLTLVGCQSTTKVNNSNRPAVPYKPKTENNSNRPKNAVQPYIPVGYVNPTGPINPKGKPAMKPVAIFSSKHDGNQPNFIADDDLTTRWSSKGNNSWLVLDYGKVSSFDAVRIAFHKGDKRSSKFDIQISKDGKDWTTVRSKTVSSGKTLAFERFAFTKIKGRYVKYIGYGNTQNSWNSLNELYAVNCKVNTCTAEEFIILDFDKK